jgi:glycosyltransferase involved in cell wall biosynthesis
MADLVSILIPVYNAEEWLSETLECALGQTWPNKEVIVVDDGSTDNSLEIARQFEGPNVKVISQENQGACAARNRALRHAQGDYIQYLDADDLMAPDKIEVQMKRLSAEAPGTIASGKWERFYDTSGEIDLESIQFQNKPFYGDYAEGLEWAINAAGHKGMMPPHAWLVPRTVTEAAGLGDESLLINQDGEYFNRVVIESEGIAFCDNAQVYYRSGIRNSVSKRKGKKVLASKWRSIKLTTDRILNEENSDRAKKACAISFRAFAEEAYPEVQELVEKSLERAECLGGAQHFSPGGSVLYKCIRRLFGRKRAKVIKKLYDKVIYDKKI